MKVRSDPTCPFSQVEEETALHFLGTCSALSSITRLTPWFTECSCILDSSQSESYNIFENVQCTNLTATKQICAACPVLSK